MSKTCASCNAKLGDSAKFCMECGVSNPPLSTDALCDFVVNTNCHYRIGFMKGGESLLRPTIIQRDDIAFAGETKQNNEDHLYCYGDLPVWISVSYMESPAVPAGNLESWVRMPHLLGLSPVPLPGYLESDKMQVGILDCLGQSHEYQRDRGLDDILLFYGRMIYAESQPLHCHILCAKKGERSWKLGLVKPAEAIELTQHEGFFVQLFLDGFYPVE